MVRRLCNPAETHPFDAVTGLDRFMRGAIDGVASDIHVEPTADRYDVRFRIDGLVTSVESVSRSEGRSLVNRLMVLANLLTYQPDLPQEGRMRFDLEIGIGVTQSFEMRVAVIPTTHGLRAAVRMPAELSQPRTLAGLGLHAATLSSLEQFVVADAGMLLVTGPAGSGKTTTIYALLEHIARVSPGVSILSLEDPVERDLAGVTQVEVSAFGQLSYERALRSVLRQDPEVLMIGEVRDAPTASLAVQAALSGHRLVCTLHASSFGVAIARLREMGLPSFQLTSSVFGVLSQRLMRKTTPQGGYRGRVPVSEFVELTAPLRKLILADASAAELDLAARERAGHVSMSATAAEFVARNLTDQTEVRRVLGGMN